jgi:hypothetical protein
MKFCKKCQVETERDPGGRCSVCRKAYSAAYRAANRDRLKAENVAWRLANLEKSRATSATNARKYRARKAAYRAAHRERRKAYAAAYRAENPERARVHKHNRKARKRASGGRLSKGLVANLFALQQGMCPCCSRPLGDDFHLDHTMPIALGGQNVDSNMQLLRRQCNLEKSAKHPIDFMQERGFLL